MSNVSRYIVIYLLAAMTTGGFMVLSAPRLPYRWRDSVSKHGAIAFFLSGFGLLMMAAAILGGM